MSTSAAGSPVRTGILKAVSFAVVTYLLLTVVAALVTPIVGGNTALGIWLGGGCILVLILARMVSRSVLPSSSVSRATGAIAIALGIGVAAAFIGFVLMVNIWEPLGLGH